MTHCYQPSTVDHQSKRVTVNSNLEFHTDGMALSYEAVGFEVQSESISHILLSIDDLDVIIASYEGVMSVYIKYMGQVATSGLCGANPDRDYVMEIFDSVSQSDDPSNVCYLPSDEQSIKKCNIDEAEAVCGKLLSRSNFDQCFQAVPNAKQFKRYCVNKICDCGRSDTASCGCDVLADLTRFCIQNDIKVIAHITV